LIATVYKFSCLYLTIVKLLLASFNEGFILTPNALHTPLVVSVDKSTSSMSFSIQKISTVNAFVHFEPSYILLIRFWIAFCEEFFVERPLEVRVSQ